MRVFLSVIILIIPFNLVKIFILNLLGHDISYKSKIGFSLLVADKIVLKARSKIGHFNIIKVNTISLKEDSFIGEFNILYGPIEINLNVKSGISKSNKIRRARKPVTYGNSSLSIGVNSFIVSNHFIDLTKSVTFGKNSILAGIRSQIWTHGYYHANTGKDRIRIDGHIYIGDNVYVGSACIFNPGVVVANAIHIGAGSVISKNLTKSGMYVSQGLRFIENDLDNIKSKLKEVKNFDLIEKVYSK